MNNKLSIGKADLKQTNFKSKKLKKTWKERARIFLWYVIVMGIAFTGLTTTLAAQNSSVVHLKPIIVEVEPKPLELTIQEHICNATNGENCEILINLAKCESSLNKWAVGVNEGSIDRGLFQINSYWHSEVSPDVAFDVYASARWTNDMIKRGQGHQWTCWTKI